jgi:hypothetical protein
MATRYGIRKAVTRTIKEAIEREAKKATRMARGKK